MLTGIVLVILGFWLIGLGRESRRLANLKRQYEQRGQQFNDRLHQARLEMEGIAKQHVDDLQGKYAAILTEQNGLHAKQLQDMVTQMQLMSENAELSQRVADSALKHEERTMRKLEEVLAISGWPDEEVKQILQELEGE